MPVETQTTDSYREDLVNSRVVIKTEELVKVYEMGAEQESVVCVSTGMQSPSFSLRSALLIVLPLGRAVVHFDLSFRLQSAQGFVAANDNLVAGLQALGNLNVGDAGDAGFHRPKYCLLAIHYKNALNFILFDIARSSRRGRSEGYAGTALTLCVLGGFLQFLARTHRESLDGDGNHIFPLRRLDFCRGRKAGPHVVRWIFQSHDNLEVFRFLCAGGGLRGRKAGTAQDSLRAHFHYLAFEHFPWNRELS